MQGKPEEESCDVSDLHDPEDPWSRSPRGQFTWGHRAVSPLFWLSLLGSAAGPLGGLCSLWPLSAALGTRAACECVKAGGMEDTAAVKGVF